jgi:hypothetical protein
MTTSPLVAHRISPNTAIAIGACGLLVGAIGWARGPQGGSNPPPSEVTQPPPTLGSGATADSNQRMIAVTGVDVTGASVLYLVDTQKMRLAVYQASSTGSSQGVRFVGARRIELDMELDGFHDNSEYSYKALKDKFVEQGLIEAPAGNAPPKSPEKPGGQ